MRNATNAYKNAMNERIRNRSYMSISLGVVNQEAQGNAKVTSESAEWSNSSNLFGRQGVNAFGEYATYEEDFFRLDGKQMFVPKVGATSGNAYVSESLDNPRLSIQFDVAYDIKGLTVDFGEIYPTRFTVASSRVTKEYTNASASWQTSDNFGVTDNLTITVIEFVGGRSHNRLSVKNVLMGIGLLFTEKDISDSTLTEKASPIAENIYSSEFSVTILDSANRFNVDDESSFVNFFELGQKMTFSCGLELADGSIEYIPMGVHYLSNWSGSKGRMTFKATDIFSFMTDLYTESNRIYTRTLYQEAVNILTSYGLSADEYIIDEDLKNVTVTNPLPECSYAQALQIVANAGRCICYQDTNGKIVIKANYGNTLDAEDIRVSASTQTFWANLDNVTRGTETVYADYEPQFFRMDGSLRFLGKNMEYSDGSYVSKTTADKNGMLWDRPNLTLTLPTNFKFTSFGIDFKGNPPREMIVKTYKGSTLQDTVTFRDLANNNVLEYSFKEFNKMYFEFVETEPYNRVVIDKVYFGNLADYTLTKRNMLENPIGTKEAIVKEVIVKVFTFENDDNGKPKEVDDSVWAKEEINVKGSQVAFENQLISTQSHAQEVAEWLGNYYKNNVSYSVNYRGEPRLMTSDYILMENDYIDNLQTVIEELTLKYNGALSGTLELKKALKKEVAYALSETTVDEQQA